MALSLDGTTGISATGNIISSGGIISATGNIYGGNIIGTLVVSSATFSGNVSAGNLLTGGLISSTGTITGSSHLGSVVSVTANVTGGNILTGGLISAAANVTAPYFIGNGAALTGLSASKIYNGTSEANIGTSGGNANITIGGTSNVVVVATTGAYVTGIVSATGNVTAPYFIGNGAALTGLSASKIYNGTSEANIGTSGGNANITIGGTSNVVVVATTGVLVTGIVSATGNVTAPYFIGNGAALSGLSASKIFNGTSEANIGTSGGNANITIGGTSNVFVVASTGIYTTGLSSVSGNVTSANFLTGGLISATGNITGGNLSGTNIVGTLTTAAQTNITSVGTLSSLAVTANVTGGNLLTGGLISAASTVTGTSFLGTVTSVTGNITGANVIITGTAAAGSGVLIVSGNIQTSTSNATANIGNASNYFNRLFAQATTALYADLAEVYKADAQYPPGTVLVFGGTQEVTMSTESHDVKIAGVVSTHPAHVMNSGLQSEFTVEVGLIGRVPCRVIGPIAAGDRVVSSNRAGVAERLDMSQYQPGVIIGKAVESYSGTDVGTIEVVVGRL